MWRNFFSFSYSFRGSKKLIVSRTKSTYLLMMYAHSEWWIQINRAHFSIHLWRAKNTRSKVQWTVYTQIRKKRWDEYTVDYYKFGWELCSLLQRGREKATTQIGTHKWIGTRFQCGFEHHMLRHTDRPKWMNYSMIYGWNNENNSQSPLNVYWQRRCFRLAMYIRNTHSIEQ